MQNSFFSFFKLCLILVSIFILTGCRGTNKQKPPSKNLKAIEVFQIGNESDLKSIVGVPQFIKLDEAGNIYIADAITLEIKIFNPNGSFIRSIGGRGNAPGQFMSIKGMDIFNDKIYISDTHGLKHSILNLQGQLLATRVINSTYSVYKRFAHVNNTFFALNLDEEKSKNDFIFTVNPDSLSKQLTCLKFSEIKHSEDEIFSDFIPTFPGELSGEDGFLAYVPQIYFGQIYLIKMINNKCETKTIEGYSSIDFPYTKVAEGQKYNYSAGDLKVQIEQSSISAFIQKKGKELIHFFTTNKNVEEPLFIETEIFSLKTNKSIGYGKINELELKNGTKIKNPILIPKAKDKNDLYYVFDRTKSLPAIRVVKLE